MIIKKSPKSYNNSHQTVYYKQIYRCDDCGCETTYVRKFRAGMAFQEVRVCQKCFNKRMKMQNLGWIFLSILLLVFGIVVPFVSLIIR